MTLVVGLGEDYWETAKESSSIILKFLLGHFSIPVIENDYWGTGEDVLITINSKNRPLSMCPGKKKIDHPLKLDVATSTS